MAWHLFKEHPGLLCFYLKKELILPLSAFAGLDTLYRTFGLLKAGVWQ